MSDAAVAAVWGALVAASLSLGALAAVRLRLPERPAAMVTAFGGGILLSAIALELLPEADAEAGLGWTSAGLLAGAVIYVGVDAWLARDEQMRAMRRSGHAAASGRAMAMTHSADAARGESIAAGIVADGIPESLALGLMAAEGDAGLALLVAVVVGNVTEAYGAAQPIIAGGHSRRFALTLLTLIGLALGLATLLGGAILAVLSISILPYAFGEASRRVALAVALGFTVGYLLSS